MVPLRGRVVRDRYPTPLRTAPLAGNGSDEAPMCDSSDPRPSLPRPCQIRMTPVVGPILPARTKLVVALLAPYLTWSRCEGRVPVLPGQRWGTEGNGRVSIS